MHNGPDGKPDTPDDLEPRDGRRRSGRSRSTLRRSATTTSQFVGALDDKGLFTPNIDGPNPKRSGNRNNVGDVWVVAELHPAPAPATPKPLRARAHLLVTVPVYMDVVQLRGRTDDARSAHGEHHRFEAAGQPFVYLVPSAAIFALDDTADASCGRLDRAAAHARGAGRRAVGRGTRTTISTTRSPSWRASARSAS